MVISSACPYSRIAVVAVLTALLVSSSSCNHAHDPTPIHLRGLSDSTTYYLTHGDDSTFTRYMRSAGGSEMQRTLQIFYDNLKAMSTREFRREASGIFPCWKRLADYFNIQYQSPQYLNDYLKFRDLSASEVTSLMRLRAELGKVERDRRLRPLERIKRYEALLEKYEEHGLCYCAGRCLLDMANCYPELGDFRTQRRLHQEALRTLVSCGDYRLRCQCLGEIGYQFERENTLDSMRYYYDEALRIARRMRYPDQAARILDFYASHYADLGRLGLAHELYGEAIEVSREYGGRSQVVRPLRYSMEFHAGIECWSIVSGLADQVKVLERLYPDPLAEHLPILGVRLEEARLKMAQGKVDEGEVMFKSIESPIKKTPQSRAVYPELLYHWGRGLLDNGCTRRAIPKLQEGLRYSSARHHDAAAARFALLLARANLAVDEIERAEGFLQQFDAYAAGERGTLRLELIERDILSVRLAIRKTDPTAAMSEISKGLTSFVRYLAGMDASPQGYLWIAKSDEYRRIMHEVAGGDAELGYGVELLWRDFYRLLGAEERQQQGSPQALADLDEVIGALEAGNLVPLARSRADAARARISGLGAVHCLFFCDQNAVVRWTASPEGIRRDPLACSLETLRRIVSETYQMLSERGAAADSPPDGALLERLRNLARILLPEEILRGTDSRSFSMLLVTTDGFLGMLPFEALDTGDGTGYAPLLMQRDVAYVRFSNAPSGGGPTGPGVILVNERASGNVRGPDLHEPRLGEAFKECEVLASLDPKAIMLKNGDATKGNLAKLWTNASYLYIASHAIRNPEAPYLMLIPLAPQGENGALEFTNLDFLDIRSVDLSSCDVVVLSGCSTGAPYIERRTVGPALGDAFLDAGAGSVVETFWDVKDEDARRLMSRFTRLWMGEKRSAVSALCEARRNALVGPRDVGAPAEKGTVRHPATWAAYSIKIGRL